MEKKIYVHVADDHEILIEGIIAVLNTDERFKSNGFSLSGEAVIKWAKSLPKTNKIHVLVLDVNMPDIDGFEVLRHLEKNPVENLKIIILSSYDDVEIIASLVKLGANGYITKNNAGEYILEGIRAVAEGKQYYSVDVRDKVYMYNPVGKKRRIGYRPAAIVDDKLTDRELSILRMIAKEYSTPEMAEIIDVSTNTIITYRKKLLKKLKVKNSVGLAMYALKHGII